MHQLDFQNEPLGDMVAVGSVSADACRIWARVDRAGEYRLNCRREDGRGDEFQASFRVPEDDPRDNTRTIRLPADGQGPLEPLTAYRFHLRHETDGRRVGEGRFETTPAGPNDAPDRFSIALFSCNQPFRDDGTLNPESASMLAAARKAMLRHHCKLLFTVGDQMYADVPRRLSLLDDDHFRRHAPPGRSRLVDCDADEVRRLYQRRYRHFFAADDWRRIHASLPCYPILDDHEIVDNWGSVPEHAEPGWQSVWRGARLAYCDYQASRVLSEPAERDHFGFEVVYGDVAACVVDLRSVRGVDNGRLLSDEQLDEVRRFLERHTDKSALFLILSVPAIHLPRWASRLAAKTLHGVEDFSDRWSSPGHLADRNRLLEMLHGHQRAAPRQMITLLSGDIHIGCAHRILWDDGTAPLYQLISSPISHTRSSLESLAAKLSIQANRRLTIDRGGLSAAIRRVPAAGSANKNPYGGLNLGIVEITRRDDGREVGFLLYGQRDGEPRCVYRSRPIAAGGAESAPRTRRESSQLTAGS